VRDLILELKRRGKTVFFSTHILTDVETLCDRVGIIMKGRLRDAGRLHDLLSAGVTSVEVTALLPGGRREPLAGGRILSAEGERVTAAFADTASADAAVAAVLAAGGRLIALTPNRETLEDYFMRRLGEGGAGAPAAAARA